ncbi:hypothetical protein HOC80_01160 [archaeon]|jgi:hypothetical protein|nr:hypothetical protein [archaeon]MBT4416692.1 hypothetical protein [archaeon]
MRQEIIQTYERIAEQVRKDFTIDGKIDWQDLAESYNIDLIRDEEAFTGHAGLTVTPKGTFLYVITPPEHPLLDLEGHTAHEFGHHFALHYLEDPAYEDEEAEADHFARLVLGRNRRKAIEYGRERLNQLTNEELRDYCVDTEGFIQENLGHLLYKHFWKGGLKR